MRRWSLRSDISYPMRLRHFRNPIRFEKYHQSVQQAVNIIRGRHLQELDAHVNRRTPSTIYIQIPPPHPQPHSHNLQKSSRGAYFSAPPLLSLLLTYSLAQKERKDKKHSILYHPSGSSSSSLLSFFNRNWLLRGGFYGYFGTLLTVTRGRVRGRDVGDVRVHAQEAVLYCVDGGDGRRGCGECGVLLFFLYFFFNYVGRQGWNSRRLFFF